MLVLCLRLCWKSRAAYCKIMQQTVIWSQLPIARHVSVECVDFLNPLQSDSSSVLAKVCIVSNENVSRTQELLNTVQMGHISMHRDSFVLEKNLFSAQKHIGCNNFPTWSCPFWLTVDLTPVVYPCAPVHCGLTDHCVLEVNSGCLIIHELIYSK